MFRREYSRTPLFWLRRGEHQPGKEIHENASDRYRPPLALAAPAAFADGDKIRATLTGYEEVPSVSTVATGEFEASISRDEGNDRLRAELQRPAGHRHAVAHPLRAERHDGGIVVWLCQTPTTPAPAPVRGPPALPASGVTVTGTLTRGQRGRAPATRAAQQIERGRARRGHRRDPRRRCVCERAHQPVPGRRDSRPDRRRPRAAATTITGISTNALT